MMFASFISYPRAIIQLDILGGLTALVSGIHFPTRKRVACDPMKYPPFPSSAWGEVIRPFKRRPTVKSMRGTRLRLDVSALIITGVSTGEER
jgi:hypothetical protein